MESRGHKAESNHRGTFLYKGKSDSLILRWPSLDKQLQADALSTQRVINRKYASASRQSSTHPVNHDSSFGGDEFSTPDFDSNLLSRTSSTASLSLGIAGPLIFPSDHGLASIADGSKSKEEEGDSDEAVEAGSCIKGNPSIVAPTNDTVSIGIGHHANTPNTITIPPPPPIALKFMEVTYQVSNKDGKDNVLLQSWVRRMQWKLGMRREKAEREESRRRKDKREKRIVKGITGYVKAGEVLALMGPSGSGKTTLLNILSGRLLITAQGQQQQQEGRNRSQPHLPYRDSAGDPPQPAGSITYNDMPFCKPLKSRIGFVMQDDVLYPHLTVKETLVYAALLRLPKNLPKKDRIERAMEVVYELGLERCQHTIIGGAFLRGVSGGERKRVCIGQEILIDPSLLFLDEPTSGLDSTTALRIIQMLCKISRVGRTVVTTIHQPSSRIFHMFDKLILLSGGHMLYFGKASASMDYFSSIGFSPQIAMNPADFLLDLASGNVVDMSLPSKLIEKCEGHTCIPFDAKGSGSSNLSSITSTKPLPKEVRKYLLGAYEGQRHALLEDLHETKLKSHMVGKHEWQFNEPTEWSTTWWSQFCVLYMRGLRERRHEYLSSLRVLQVFASAVVIGCLWWHSSIQTQRQLADQVGLLFFIATYWGFFPLFTALFTFPLERAILAKERGSNMYRLSAYFMARTLGDIPLDFCLPLLFHVLVYFMAHLRPTTSAFFLTLFVILLSTIASQGMGIGIGAIFMDLKKATTLASVVLLTFMLSGGFFVQAIPKFISWIKYISYNYYTFKLLASLQYDAGQEFGCDSSTGCQRVENSTVFHNISLDGGAKEVFVLLAMIIGYRFIAYLALRYMKQIV